MQEYNPVKDEKEILKFWEENGIVEKARKKNKGNKSFYFLDGPPYTSGKIHLGTAWNKSLKDFVTRYKRMQGLDVWDRAGYDMHGLPTEGKVQAALGLKTKEEILNYGLEKFTTECRDFAVRNLKQMNKDFKRIGVWLDFDNAYQTIDNEYIEGTWWLVKKAHEKKRLYEDQMTMTWCGSCQTSLAKHELEYKEVKDKSLYVKFQVKGKKDEYLVIWTTTPWTIPFNLGVMVNPALDYVKAKVGKEIWIVAKDLADRFIKEKSDKDYELIEEFKGKKLEGLHYVHPMEDVLSHHFDKLRKKSKKVHSVLMSEEYVTTENGTGLVHMAPGCGPEDYEVGHREGISPFNQVDEAGYYDSTMGPFSGHHVKSNNDSFIEDLEKRGALALKEDVKHDYAHCWRCKNPVLYRTTTQWFFKVEDLIPRMRKLNKEKMYWVPDWAGSNQFDSWLENLRDNGITRQRFWGSPLPVWRCNDCGEYVVVESRKDMEKHGASHIPEDLHKPWIDEVTLPCAKCKKEMRRIPDIMDVWIDAGVDSWASLGYPKNEELFKKLYPADFITEAKDQIRGWFNLLFVASILGMDDISFKACYMHGYITDAYGQKFSKSLGNYVSPEIVLEKYGADAFRYYVIGASAPGVDMNYNEEDLIVKSRNLNILWNLHNYVIDMAKTMEKNPSEIKKDIIEKAGDEEKYIFSKLNTTIKKVTEYMDKYYLNQVPSIIEELYMELSRTYIQLVREKSNSGTDEEKEQVLFTAYTVLLETIKMMAPVAPLISEMMYQNFRSEFNLSEESIHLFKWPQAEESAISGVLESDMKEVKSIVQAILSAREKAQIGIRWPLGIVTIETTDENTKKSISDMEGLIKSQTNVKSVAVVDKFDKADVTVEPNFKTLGPEFGKESKEIIKMISDMGSSEILDRLNKKTLSFDIGGKTYKLEEKHLVMERAMPKGLFMGEFGSGNVYLDSAKNEELLGEGYTRELMRRLQSFRKDAGLKKRDSIRLFLNLDKELYSYVLPYKDQIMARVGCGELEIATAGPVKKYSFSSTETIKGLKLEACFEVI